MGAERPVAGLDREELVAVLKVLGEKPYRADQVLRWVHVRRAASFETMTNLAAALRAKLAATLTVCSSDVASRVADEDGTIKLAVRLDDGHTIEAVMIPAGERRTACVSTQVGCPVGCRFCASGSKGLARNLTTAEIVEQVLHLARTCGEEEHLTHLVFMGIGEGLLNFEALAKAMRILNAPWGMHLGARRMTVSTVGVRGGIAKLAALDMQVTLAISLHAPSDALRRQLIPFAKLLSIRDVIDEATDYFEATGRDVTFEYVLLAGVNDSPKQAEALARLVKPCHARVNLIPYNEVTGVAFSRPTREAVRTFRDVLVKGGVRVTRRRRRGSGANAACGQLRRDAMENDAHGRS